MRRVTGLLGVLALVWPDVTVLVVAAVFYRLLLLLDHRILSSQTPESVYHFDTVAGILSGSATIPSSAASPSASSVAASLLSTGAATPSRIARSAGMAISGANGIDPPTAVGTSVPAASNQRRLAIIARTPATKPTTIGSG